LRTIDQAIRHALQKIDATDPVLRNKLYQATWQTHEKMLDTLTQVSDEEKLKRRQALKNIIHAIETEIQNTTPLPSTTEPIAPHPPPHTPELVAARPQNQPGITPRQPHAQHTPQKKSLFRGNGFVLVLIAILLFVAWSFYNSLISPYQTIAPEESKSDPVTELIEQDTVPSLAVSDRQEQTSSPPERDWIRVMDPADMTDIQTKGNARVRLHEEGGERFMRLHTTTLEDRVIIEIGASLIARAKDKGAIFNIIARSATGQLTQLSVACDIGGLSTCGRWRFELPPMRENLLFGVDNLDEMRADSALTLSLSVSGETNEEHHAMDIFGLEVSFDE